MSDAGANTGRSNLVKKFSENSLIFQVFLLKNPGNSRNYFNNFFMQLSKINLFLLRFLIIFPRMKDRQFLKFQVLGLLKKILNNFCDTFLICIKYSFFIIKNYN